MRTRAEGFLLLLLAMLAVYTLPGGHLVGEAAAANVVQNPGFEAGSSPWWFYSNAGGNLAIVSPGSEGLSSARFTVAGAGSNMQFSQNDIPLEANTKYTLTFSAYSSTGSDLAVYLHKNDSPYTNYGLTYAPNLTNAWQTFTVEFTTSGFAGTVNDGRLRFWFVGYAQPGDTFFIDDVRLEKGSVSPPPPPPPPQVSVVVNGGFEAGTPPWVFYTNGTGTFADDATGDGSVHAGHVGIVTPGANVQLFQAGLVLEGSTQYRLSFKGKSSTGHDVSASVQKHGTPYTGYGLSGQVFDLTTSWQSYSVQFTTSGFAGTVNDGRLMFWIAPYDAAGDQYYFDDVVLEKVVAGPVPPAITTQPTNQTVTVGQTATFSVVATGTAPLSYQWQKNGGDIVGATAATYTTPVTVLSDSGSVFRCVVTNTAGDATSNGATLTVQEVPPVVNLVVNGGFEAGTAPWVFYTNGAGTFANDGAGDGSARAGHINITTEGTNVQLYQAGLVLEGNAQYRLRFKGYANSGHDVAVSVQKHGSPYSSYGLANRVFDLGTGWQTFSVEFTTSGFAGTVNDGRLMFWMAPYDAAGDQYYFDDVILEKVVLTPAPPTITTQPANQTVSVGQTATFSVGATGTTPFSYQWQKNGGNITGATNSSYTTPPTVLGDSGSVFRCVVTNGLGSATSNAATLTVTSTPPPPGPEPPPPSFFPNQQLVYIDRTFNHTTSYDPTLLGETPYNASCIYVYGIWYPLGGIPAPQPAPGGVGEAICNHEAFKFFQLPSWVPGNWVSPVNYSLGTLYQRIIIYEKPTSTTARYASCLFQDQVLAERHACANTVPFTGPGTYYGSQAMTTLYQYYGNNYSQTYTGPAVYWDRRSHVIMVHMTDANGNQPDSYPGFMDKWIGTPNWSLYYPTKVRYTAIIVPPGGGAPIWNW